VLRLLFREAERRGWTVETLGRSSEPDALRRLCENAETGARKNKVTVLCVAAKEKKASFPRTPK